MTLLGFTCNPRGRALYLFQDTCIEHHVEFYLDYFFQMYGDWSIVSLNMMFYQYANTMYHIIPHGIPFGMQIRVLVIWMELTSFGLAGQFWI